MTSSYRVAVLQHRLLHYRVGLFTKLRQACAERGIELRLVHGQASKQEMLKRDTGTLPWADVVSNRFVRMGDRDLVWQPFPHELDNCDLVICMQESRILSNYRFLANRRREGRKVAYWGHGKNFQTDSPAGPRERWKQFWLNRVDWWFAYTEITRDILVDNGYPAARITVLDNAIDNERLGDDLAALDDGTLAKARAAVGLAANGVLGLFCGSLYPDKKLPFLVDAATRIHALMPNFRLAVIGDGPDADHLQNLIEDKPWAHWLGTLRGTAKAAYFSLASVVLNPGLVGLHVLDAFCAGLPMLTTANARHSPEIAYLQHGSNGLVLPDDPDIFAHAAIALLNDANEYAAFRSAARSSASRFTVGRMVEHFADGMDRCVRSG